MSDDLDLPDARPAGAPLPRDLMERLVEHSVEQRQGTPPPGG